MLKEKNLLQDREENWEEKKLKSWEEELERVKQKNLW